MKVPAPTATTVASYETPELVRSILEVAGHVCTFTGGTVPMIPGQRLGVMADFHSPYDINTQNYTFQAYGPDLDAADVTTDSTFTLQLHGTLFVFEVRVLLPDMTGWTKMEADLKSMETI